MPDGYVVTPDDLALQVFVLEKHLPRINLEHQGTKCQRYALHCPPNANGMSPGLRGQLGCVLA
jgi:hypothetical protein